MQSERGSATKNLQQLQESLQQRVKSPKNPDNDALINERETSDQRYRQLAEAFVKYNSQVEKTCG
jgi:hypothetical protein